MGLDLTPRDYLEMLTEEYREYLDYWHAHGYQVSIRKAINCCGLSNALPEIIIAQYRDTQPQKVHHAKDHVVYRADYLQVKCKAHLTVQDLCEFSKHGPKLWRESVSVRDATNITRQEGVARLPLMFPEPRDVERLWVRHQDGREELMNEVLEQVIASWKTIFDQDKL
jgi:hypothetical protein